MRYTFLFAALLSLTVGAQAQKLIAKNGHIRFFSHTPIEDIEANNVQAVSILNTETGDLQFQLLIKSFEFEKKLMQEHFNENYMESDEFPKASFEGSIADIGKLDLTKDGSYPVKVSGKLTIHGVTKEVSVEGKLIVKQGKVTSQAEFVVKPEDYGIVIPDVVQDKIAKEIRIFVDVNYASN